MTTIIPFAPTLSPGSPPFQFQATFDGQLYNCTVVWSIYGQRWYVYIVDQSGNLVVYLPLVGSSNGRPLSALAWSVDAGGMVTAETQDKHGFRLGMVVVLSIVGAAPIGYNVLTPVWVTGPRRFIYPLAVDPGAVVVPGSYSFDINLVKGYFLSSLVWRVQSGNLEISP